MIVLSCKDIYKSYGIRDVLKNITLSINEGDKVGIIGANGEGKSTLFKILTKEISQDSGEVFIDKTKSLGYLSQNLNLNNDKNIYEETLSVFNELINIENRLSDLEIKMNEPYDESKADYHNKLIKREFWWSVLLSLNAWTEDGWIYGWTGQIDQWMTGF